MEDALVRTQCCVHFIVLYVLILVLMEDALVLILRVLLYFLVVVLILVLMEDALVPDDGGEFHEDDVKS